MLQNVAHVLTYTTRIKIACASKDQNVLDIDVFYPINCIYKPYKKCPPPLLRSLKFPCVFVFQSLQINLCFARIHFPRTNYHVYKVWIYEKWFLLFKVVFLCYLDSWYRHIFPFQMNLLNLSVLVFLLENTADSCAVG